MKTVFVIGAGASKEIGMPTGDELKSTISLLLKVKEGTVQGYENSPLDIKNAIYCLSDADPKEISKYNDAMTAISEGLPYDISIDNFIDKHKENNYIVSLGKLMIVYAILYAEKNSNLYSKDKNIYANYPSNTWYIPFFQRLMENCHNSIDEIKERLNDITFIIFNYDRCFETFFRLALMKNYLMDLLTAEEIVSEMNIIHPYGIVGNSPLGVMPEYTGGSSSAKPGDFVSQSLVNISKEIKSFTESIDPKDENNKKLVEACAKTEKIIFLGFAFALQNMKLLYPSPRKDHLHLYGTRKGMSDYEMQRLPFLWSFIHDALHPTLIDVKCVDFFKEFQYSLSFIN
ncbi:hypothetical protein AGMMS50268_39130 [Spirochaetia bacterium]|nr:hypothetical protein AGMMS50268_39130 [Spirochaetia bacterium]